MQSKLGILSKLLFVTILAISLKFKLIGMLMASAS
ncbi:hypothetical protein [Clostridium phage Amboise]|nr:hypothetical protein [Clostridium phage Amboise]